MSGTVRIRFVTALVVVLVTATLWESRRQQPEAAVVRLPRKAQVGVASYYGPGFNGKKTASGRRFHSYRFTAAHKSLPLGTEVRVTNLENYRQVVVEITDRGPYVNGRVIDLSTAAAIRLKMKHEGLTFVKIEILNLPALPDS